MSMQHTQEWMTLPGTYNEELALPVPCYEDNRFTGTCRLWVR